MCYVFTFLSDFSVKNCSIVFKLFITRISHKNGGRKTQFFLKMENFQ